MWKARGWEVALPRCQLRGSKAEVDGEFMDSASCWLRWEKRLKELMKRKIEGAGEQGEGAKEGSREGSRGGIKDDGMEDMEEHYRFTHPSIQQQLIHHAPWPRL